MDDSKIYLGGAGNYINNTDIEVDEQNNYIFIQMNGFRLKIDKAKYDRGLTMVDFFTAETI